MPHSSSPKYSNRLINEKSPYLLQHASNPVGWFPWSEEAFDIARKKQKPIFLSIGYSTCHWCHVMEQESFEDNSIAEVINHYFVPVKVDREERPDIDSVYMSAVIQMTGQGGWPLTLVLTPDKQPFFGGTYFPPFAKWGSAGLVDILKTIAERWNSNQQELIASGQKIAETLFQQSQKKFISQNLPDRSLLDEAAGQYKNHFDAEYGGFGMQPKFPAAHNLLFLLRFWYRSKNHDVLNMVTYTLEKMSQSGMYDHLGGGFHRYATDRYWQIPHFEKMLYDQAMLVRIYTEAYQATHNFHFKDVARQTCDYVLTDLMDSAGGFYSAEDADSVNGQGDMKEGAYYVWTENEIRQVLNAEEFDLFADYFSIRTSGNVHSDPHQEFIEKNILFTQYRSFKDVAVKFNLSEAQVREKLMLCRQKMLSCRHDRQRPHLDDKILTDWNALMIGALTLAGKVFKEPKYIDAAQNAIDFIFSDLFLDGDLYHRYRDGDVAVKANLDDFAFLINACLDLFETCGDVKFYARAIQLSEKMLEDFWDSEKGGFYFTSSHAEKLIFRTKDVYDGAMPSGNAMAAQALIRLAHMSLDDKYDQCLKDMFTVFGETMKQYPMGYAHMLSVFDFILGPVTQIVLQEPKDNNFTRNAWDEVYANFIPNKIVIPWKKQNQKNLKNKSVLPEISYITEHLNDYDAARVYVCENNTCRLPVSDMKAFKRILKPLTRDSYEKN